MNHLVKSILKQSIDAGYLTEEEVQSVKDFILNMEVESEIEEMNTLKTYKKLNKRLKKMEKEVGYDSKSLNF